MTVKRLKSVVGPVRDSRRVNKNMVQKGKISNGAGITLIEVMVAILILTIVIAGGSFLFVTGRSQISLRGHYRVATQLVAQKLEELKADNYDDIEEGETEESFSLEDLSYSRSIETEDVGLYKRVRVTVRWEQMSKEHNVSLVTFIAPK